MLAGSSPSPLMRYRTLYAEAQNIIATHLSVVTTESRGPALRLFNIGEEISGLDIEDGYKRQYLSLLDSQLQGAHSLSGLQKRLKVEIYTEIRGGFVNACDFLCSESKEFSDLSASADDEAILDQWTADKVSESKMRLG